MTASPQTWWPRPLPDAFVRVYTNLDGNGPVMEVPLPNLHVVDDVSANSFDYDSPFVKPSALCVVTDQAVVGAQLKVGFGRRLPLAETLSDEFIASQGASSKAWKHSLEYRYDLVADPGTYLVWQWDIPPLTDEHLLADDFDIQADQGSVTAESGSHGFTTEGGKPTMPGGVWAVTVTYRMDLDYS